MKIHKHVSLNLNLRGLGESPTLAMSERCRILRSENKEVFNMSIGQSPFPVPHSVVEAMKDHAHEKTYLPVRGLPELRAAVAEHHKQKTDIELTADNILIGPGSKILMYLMQLSFYGELIVPTPCWVSYVPQAQLIGRQVRLINTTFEDKWHLTANMLEDLCESEDDTFRPRMVVLNYPGNPDGGSYSASELKSIADVARRFEIILLSDEIYSELHHKGEHISVAKFYPEGTIVSSGLSKWAACGGWRLGTFAFPDELKWLMSAMSDAASQTYTSVSSPTQWAAVTAFKGSVDIERYLWHGRRIFSALGNRCAEMIKETGARLHDPTGAFYLFPDFSPIAENLEKRGIYNSAQLCDAILSDSQVATIPGSAFQRPENEFTLRMSYCNFDGDKALAASELIPLDESLPNGFLEENCTKTLESTKRICDFINKSA